MLTGQYAHNHGVRGNTLPAGGYSKLAPHVGNTLPVWLQKAGYYTAHIGKFLNGYGNTSPDTEVPPGWSEWYGALDDPDAYTGGTYTMYGYTLNENGSIVHYGSTPDVVDPATYQTDVYAAKAADFVAPPRAEEQALLPLGGTARVPHRERAACTLRRQQPARRAPPRGGARQRDPSCRGPTSTRPTSPTSLQSIQNLTLMNPTQQEAVRARYRAQSESLLAVDEMIGSGSPTP